MSSFNHCVTSLSLNGKIPGKELKDAANDYRKQQGLSAEAAMIRAVEDRLEMAQMEERKIVKLVRDAYEQQGGKQRKPKAKPLLESVVLREKATGKAVMETSDPAKVAALNTDKYEAVPVSKHLAEVNDAESKAGKAAREPSYSVTDDASQDFKNRVLDAAYVYNKNMIERVSSEGMLAAKVKRSGIPIFIYDGKFGREQYKQALAEAKAAGVEGFNKIYVYANLVTYTGAGIDPVQISSLPGFGKEHREAPPRYSVNEQGVPEAEFGPVHTEFADDIPSAVSRLLNDKTGEAIIHTNQLGDVSLVYGDDKTGVAHIAKRRGSDFLARLPDILKNGTLYSKIGQPGRVFLGTDTHEAVIALTWNGDAKTWLMSAYEKYPDLKPVNDVQQSSRSQTVAARTNDGKNWQSQAELYQTVGRGLLGSLVRKMMHTGHIVLHKSVKTLPDDAQGVKGVQGLFSQDGKIHLVAGNIAPGNSQGVLLHEAFHEGARKLQDHPGYRNMMGRLGSLYRQSEQSGGNARAVFDKARERVQAASRKGAVATKMEVEEFGAYAIEEYNRDPASLPAAIRKWVQDFIGMVKAYLALRHDLQLGPVTPEQLSAVAKWALLDHAAQRRHELIAADGWFSVAADDASALPQSATSEPVELTPPEQGTLRKLEGALIYNMNRIKQVQDRIMKLGGHIGDAANYVLAEINRPGKIADKLLEAERKMFAPLMERLAKSGFKQAQLEELLHAEHAGERNTRVAKINPKHDPNSSEYVGIQGSGMNDKTAREILDKYKDATELHAIAQQARDIAKEVLNLKYEYGLITQKQFELLANMYQHYVPLKGAGEYGPKIKHAMGHGERQEHILQNITRDFEQAVVVGEKNVARQALLRLVLQFRDAALWTVGVPPTGRYLKQFHNYVVKYHGSVVAEFTTMPEVRAFLDGEMTRSQDRTQADYEVETDAGERVTEFTKQLQANEIMVYVKGTPVRIQLKDEKLASQLRPIINDKDKTRWFVDTMRGLNRWKAMVYTGKNPVFIFRNAMRDALTGTINMTGHHGAATAARALAKYPASFAAMLQYGTTNKAPDSEMGLRLNEYRRNGGKMGASHMSDLEAAGKKIDRLYDDAYGVNGFLSEGRAGKAAWVGARKLIGALGHGIEIGNQAAENALRLSLFATLREQGVSPAQAAAAAKTVTVDFDRKGEMTNVLGALYLFINPAIQGTANMVKTMAHGEHKKQAWALVGAVAAAGLAAAGAGMDDDKDRWLGEDWSTRTKNLIFYIGKRRVAIPVSQEYAPFYAAGVAIGEARRGESATQTSARIISSFIDAYFPLQGAFNPDSDNHGADLALASIPTALRPHVESAFNRNGFGTEIVPESDSTKNRPDNLKMYRSTKNTVYDKTAQGIAAAGELLGIGGKYENDITKVSPETLKHLTRTYGGGLLQFIVDSGSLASMAGEGAGEIETGDIPILKDFVKDKDSKPLRSRYYEVSKNAQQAIAEFKEAKKAGDSDELGKIADDPAKGPLLGLGNAITHFNKAAAALADEKVDTNASTDLTAAQKRQKLKALDAEEEQFYRDAIEAFQ